jgi:hypothetical protein
VEFKGGKFALTVLKNDFQKKKKRKFGFIGGLRGFDR